MEDVIKMVLDFLLSQGYTLYTAVFIGAMTTFIFIILSLLKKPIKLLTGKIKSEKLRKLANKVIILLAFGLSIGLWLLAHHLAPSYFSIDRVEILLTGALPVVAYALGDGLLTGPTAKAVVKKILEVTEDGKLTETEVKEVFEVAKSKTHKAEDCETDKAIEPVAEQTEEEPKSAAESALNDLLGR